MRTPRPAGKSQGPTPSVSTGAGPRPRPRPPSAGGCGAPALPSCCCAVSTLTTAHAAMATRATTNFFNGLSPVPLVLGTLPQLALDVLLRPVVAHDVHDVRLGDLIDIAVQHAAIGAADDLFRLRARHRSPVAILRAVSQGVAHLLLAPAVVDDPAAVLAQARVIGIAAEDILVSAADDPVGIFTPPIASAAVVLQIAEAIAARQFDTQRRDAIVPVFVTQVPDAPIEDGGAAAESTVPEDRDSRPAEYPDRGDA